MTADHEVDVILIDIAMPHLNGLERPVRSFKPGGKSHRDLSAHEMSLHGKSH